MATKTVSMDELLDAQELKQLKTGDVIEGIVMTIKKHELWVDLGVYGIGVVHRREMCRQ
jgi:ribosomal protein S1